MDLILASESPRRRELLARLGVPFRVRSAHTEELSAQREPAEVARDLARQKARAVRSLEPQATIIAADTLVALDDAILGKPRDEAENLAHLTFLSGRRHTVFTGVAVLAGEHEEVAVEATHVTFRELSASERAWYARSGEGLDKAGGYGIQELGLALVARLDGDYSNVVGFPLPRVIEMLRRAGVPVLQHHAQSGGEGA